MGELTKNENETNKIVSKKSALPGIFRRVIHTRFLLPPKLRHWNKRTLKSCCVGIEGMLLFLSCWIKIKR